MLNINDEVFDKIGYLNLIQNNISRMASNSAIMKGFAATIIAAIVAMNFAEIAWYYMLVATIPIVSFILLDTYYLQLEKKYRNLYNLVADGQIPTFKYYLDLSNPYFDEYKTLINHDTGFWKCLISKSVISFYIWFILSIIAMLVIIA